MSTGNLEMNLSVTDVAEGAGVDTSSLMGDGSEASEAGVASVAGPTPTPPDPHPLSPVERLLQESPGQGRANETVAGGEQRVETMRERVVERSESDGGKAWVFPSSTLGLGAVALGGVLVLWALWQRWTQVRRAELARESVRRASLESAGAGLATRLPERAPGRGMSAGLEAPVVASADASEQALRQTARALAAELDERARRLEALVASADERLAALRAAEEEHQAMVARVQAGAEAARRAAEAEASKAPPLVGVLGQHWMEAGPPPARNDGLSSFGAGASHREVFDLADQGLTPVQIAQRLGKPTGQVELVLNLRRAALAT